jgi:putative DNA primase/helicase
MMNAIDAFTAEMNDLEASFSRLPVTSAVSNSAASGTLADWQRHVAAPAVGDELAVLAISLAFVGPLLPLAGGGTNVGVSLVGPSGVGKTQIARLPASVWGGPRETIHSSKATPSAHEAMAAAADGGMLILDELDRGHDPAGIIRMLMEGHGKLRARRDRARQQATFRLAFLTTSERDYAGPATSIAIRMAARSQTIPTIAGGADRFHGTAGTAFLAAMNVSGQETNDVFEAGRLCFTDENAYAGVAPDDKWRASQMAVIAAAGEVAIRLGILPWSAGTAIAAIGYILNP